MALKIAINGMGVIGREMFRTLFEQSNIEIAFLNDSGVTAQNLAYLLNYDSVYHKELTSNKATSDENKISVNGKQIPLYQFDNIANLPIGEFGIDLVLECTGTITNKAVLQRYIDAGAKKVIVCYNSGGSLKSIAHNVNQEALTPEDKIIAIPEMEWQVSAAVLKCIHERFTIQYGFVKAFRSFTNAQPTLDSYCSTEIVRGRSAPCNITPVNDTFAQQVGLLIPDLNGKIDGFAYRSPVVNGSIMDLTVKVSQSPLLADLKAALKSSSNESLGYNEDPLCSSDALSFEAPQIIVSQTKMLTSADNGNLINISVAYDNIRGYCNQMKRFLQWATGSTSNWLR